jgi:hypothetical protein
MLAPVLLQTLKFACPEVNQGMMVSIPLVEGM